MGWVVEQAGGRASTGAGAMLDQEVSPSRFLVSRRLRPRSLFSWSLNELQCCVIAAAQNTDEASRGCHSVYRLVYSLPPWPITFFYFWCDHICS